MTDSQGTLPTAVIRRTPEDFVVEEIPAYPASGRGEHMLVTFRKTGRTTPDAVRAIARVLEADLRGTGFAGMKDRHAITTQTASFPYPLARDAEPILARLSGLDGIEILAAARHENKLKPGHLAGNRFRIALREIGGAGHDSSARDVVAARLRKVGVEGVPNAFGPQRFGRDGNNPARTLAWLSGKERGPRDKREQRMLFSSLQSLLFNRVLERRVEGDTWSTILPGDLAKKHDSGGLFDVPLEGPELEDARSRGAEALVSPTGPMFGLKMRWPSGEPAAIERAVLNEGLGEGANLDAHRHLGEGTRRALRLAVTEVVVEEVGEDGLTVSFVLPKGGYATTVLGRACLLVDASRARAASDGSLATEGTEQEEVAGAAGSDAEDPTS